MNDEKKKGIFVVENNERVPKPPLGASGDRKHYDVACAVYLTARAREQRWDHLSLYEIKSIEVLVRECLLFVIVA